MENNNETTEHLDVFNVKVGERIYDQFMDRYGCISSIRETSADCIDAFITWDDEFGEHRMVWSCNFRRVTE